VRWHSAASVSKKTSASGPWRLARQALTSGMCLALLASSLPQPVLAQDAPQTSTQAGAATDNADDQDYSSEQLDALLAPIALYPDQLLTQILMASTYADQVKAANDWVQDPAHKSLTGDALDQALVPFDWDPSVKSLVPFPQVLETMADNFDWTQQLGYAMSVQQSDVMDSVQRLRQQAQAAGQLKSSDQQTVSNEGSTIIIVPAQPSVVYVPVYNPTVVYGAWLYPAYPPVYYPPPPGYVAGSALMAGLAFGAGVAISASLWGWATPNWGHHNVNVNVNRYNNINVNRTQISNNNWNGGNRPGASPGAGNRPPARGPVGRPTQKGPPANSNGRPNGSGPGSINKPPAGATPGNRPNVSKPPGTPGANRPTSGQAGNKPAPKQGGNKPSVGQGGTNASPGQGANRPTTSQGSSKPSTRPPANKPSVQQGTTKPSPPQSGTRPTGNQGGNKPSPGQGGNKPTVGQSGTRPQTGQSNRPGTKPASGQGNRSAGGSRGKS
jgi:hypothetical protein